MVLIADVVHTFPLFSAAVWAIIGVGAFARYSTASPFVRALTLFCLLVSAGCLVDWFLLTFVAAADPLARAVASLRTSLLAIASLVILLASKWLARGHSRYDTFLVIPVLGALLVIWDGMTTTVTQEVWGPSFGRDPLLFGLFVIQEVAYYLVAIGFAISLARRRWYLPPRLRRPIYLSVAALLVFVGLYLPTNVYAALVPTPLPPLFSSVLFLPALLDVVAFVSRSKEELGEIFRAVSEVQNRLLGLYVYYKTGEPLVAVAGARTLPLEAEQLAGVVDVVGDFVETSVRRPRKYEATSMQFDRLGIVAVRGRWIIVVAVYEGAAYDALRGEISRYLAAFEGAREQELRTLEGAARVADQVADDLHAWLKPLAPEPTS